MASEQDREVIDTPTPIVSVTSAPTDSIPAPTPGAESSSCPTPEPTEETSSKAPEKSPETVSKDAKRCCSHRKAKAEKEREEKEKAEKETAAAAAAAAAAALEVENKEKEEAEKKKKKKKSRSKRRKGKSRKVESDSSDSDSSSDEADDSANAENSESSSSSSSSSESDFGGDSLAAAVTLLLARRGKSKREKKAERKRAKAKRQRREERRELRRVAKEEKAAEAKAAEGDSACVLEYKRVDELFDKELHDWDIRETVPHSKDDKYSSFVFTVRRIFNYEGHYTETQVDVKSPLLKDALIDVIGDIRGVSLVEDVPEVDPNMLFNYYSELQAWIDKASGKVMVPIPDDKQKTRKRKKKIDPLTGAPVAPLTEEEKKQQIDHVKLLLEYLDTDFKNIKTTLYPLLENKSITFDLLWAVLKPNTIMYTTCAGSNEPRAFKLEYAQMNASFMRGKWWSVEGRYLEYDGKDDGSDAKSGGGFGWGTVMVDIDSFKGARKIGSLACYPLRYRKDCDDLTAKLIERGKKFVSLRGMQYKAHSGLAFVKKKRQYLKVHVKGRIMIDPVTFRRINPNYVITSVKSRNNDVEDDENANYFHFGEDDEEDGNESDACSDCCCAGNDDEEDEEERQRKAMRFVKDEKGDWQIVTKGEEEEKSMKVETLEKPDDNELEKVEDKEPELEDEDYLTASPVVLGWAFNEKLWLEFPVETVEEITWNDKAFDSLVLPEEQKSIVRALVESHTASEGSSTIDDIIAGKGRGLVTVLHGPPGVGKTLTAEGIAELLKRPLYCVSSGELGTNPAQLEHELQKILDIAHTWGAVLLLDEADVFLEKRTLSDMHRNALVSIFLRLLEYFQGILFLTTNRVATFDEAFQSRIHVALRYNELGYKAKLKIWNMFVEMVRVVDGGGIKEDDLEWLAKKNLNGRQIKNIVRTAQALSKSKSEIMAMKHIKVVMSVAEGFDNDLRGTGRMDSLHAYA